MLIFLWQRWATIYQPINRDELAFAELIAFIDESLGVEEPTMRKFSDPVKLEGEQDKVNSTRRKSAYWHPFQTLQHITKDERFFSTVMRSGVFFSRLRTEIQKRFA